MIQFTYSFCMALLNSFWQAALLMLLYLIVDKIIHRNNAPLAKRNFLYAAITVQLVLFVFTFFIYIFDAKSMGNMPGMVQNIATYVGGSSLQTITPWIFGLYTFIIAHKLVKAVYTWFHFKQLYKTGLQKPTIELKLFTTIKAHQFGIKRKVKLWLSNSINTPVTFGFFKPVILLPVSLCNNISMQQAESLILHELAHIRTNDYLLNWFLLSAETIFFFNPFVIGLCKHIRLEREKNCDMQVISFDYSPALYAETLLLAERMKQPVPNFQLAAVSRKKYLLQRIQFFTNEKIINKTLRFNIVAPIIGLILLVMLSAAVLFQSGNTLLPLQSATDMRFFPFNNYIITDLESEKQNISQLTDMQNLQCELQNPVIKTNILIQEKPVCNPEPAKAEGVDISPMPTGIALPITTQQNDAAHQIIIKEEGSGSASVKVYYLSFENGKWILQPEWVITANEIIIDSLSGRIDTLKNNIKRLYPDQQ